nr:hypothetical protein [Tanacetum cinerariifolium]
MGHFLYNSQSIEPRNIHHEFSIRGCKSPSPYQNPSSVPPQAPHLQHPPNPSVEPLLALLLLLALSQDLHVGLFLEDVEDEEPEEAPVMGFDMGMDWEDVEDEESELIFPYDLCSESCTRNDPFREHHIKERVGGGLDKIMLLKMLKQKSVKKMVKKRAAKAIEDYEKSRANSNNVGGSGSGNAGGTMNVQGCLHKTFMNGKPHPFNEIKAVIGLRHWIEKVEKVFEICKIFLATKIQRMEQELWTLTLNGDDIEAYNNRFHEVTLMCHNLVSTKKKNFERYIRGFPKRIKGNITSSRPTTLHDAINMAPELVKQAVKGRVAQISKNSSYEVELADRKVVSTNIVLSGCTLALFNHVFKRDLLFTRLVHILLSNGEILEIQGERPEKDPESLSYIKDDENKFEDIPIIHDFLKVFPDDLLGLPLVHEIEFRIDLIPDVLPVIKLPYQLAPFEILELSNQLNELQEKALFDQVIHHEEHLCYLLKRKMVP